jgi:hypothetical protein
MYQIAELEIEGLIKMCSTCISQKRGLPSALYQSWVHISASTVSGVRLLQKSFMVLLAMLKVDYDGTDEAGTANKCRAIREMVGYFVHYPSTNLLCLALQLE